MVILASPFALEKTSMSTLMQIVLANVLFLVGSLVLLWSIKRWIERRKPRK
jgi:membrane protein implicated in regulation of membrane protease activity